MKYQKVSTIRQQIIEKKREVLKYLKDHPEYLETTGRYKDPKAEKLCTEFFELVCKL